MIPDVAFRFDYSDDKGTLYFANAVDWIAATSVSDVVPALRAADQAVRAGYWVAGFLTYEAAAAFDRAFSVVGDTGLPLAGFGVFGQPSPPPRWPPTPYRVGPWVSAGDRETYDRSIAAVLSYIRQGLTYQVNYTVRYHAQFAGDPYSWYLTLVEAQHPRYAAYARLPDADLLSASPELFFRLDQGVVVTRPMKGTRARGRHPAADFDHRRQLIESAKDRAENLMIVDLVRNDLGKVAVTGSVTCEKLCEIERYPSVWQMTSTVLGKLSPPQSWIDVMGALFPSGSVTGAPKVSTMRIIAELEREPRGIYCGTLGYVAPNGRAIFNVAIRTLSVDRRSRVEFGVGGGITADSEANAEYAEVKAKTRFLSIQSPRFELLETLRLDAGRFWLVDDHLDRLQRSADFWQFPCPAAAIRSALDRLADANPDGYFRVRLLLNGHGRFTTEISPWRPKFGVLRPVAWASEAVQVDAITFHKTTRRERYERWHPPQSAVYDHLLFDRDGHVTEFTRGNLVIERGGRWFTPPLTCGLLPGTLRGWLINHRLLEERILSRTDVETAAELWFINSLQGWVPVHLTRGAEE